MNKLKNSTAYLAGPIQYTEDDGVSWREVASKFCKDTGIHIFNPVLKPRPYVSEISDEIKIIQALIAEGKFEEAHQYVKEKIVHVDLRMVDLSDFVIAYIDPNIHTCGSYHEVFHAWEQKKPVLVFVEGGRNCTPAWLIGIIKPKYLFDNLTDLLHYLISLAMGDSEMDSKWVLFHEK